MSETAYREPVPSNHRLEHRYGPQVHLLADPWSLSALARLGHPDTAGLPLHALIDGCFRRLLQAAAEQLPSRVIDLPTRMTASAGVPFTGRLLDAKAPVVVVDVARAGMIPAHVLQLALHEVLDPEAVRVDHLFMQRDADPRTGRVSGVTFHGSKIGGGVDGATVIIPDPMGATGASMLQVLEHYREAVPGTPRRIVACHLIVTPEYLARLARAFPEVVVYALRLDRGLSSPEVLATVPGTRWDEERGLDPHDYIVPGAGGLGEVLNNAFV